MYNCSMSGVVNDRSRAQAMFAPSWYPRPTQPGQPSVGRHNEFRQWSRQLLRVPRNSMTDGMVTALDVKWVNHLADVGRDSWIVFNPVNSKRRRARTQQTSLYAISAPLGLCRRKTVYKQKNKNTVVNIALKFNTYDLTVCKRIGESLWSSE